MTSDLLRLVAYLRGLRGFLRRPVSAEASRRLLRAGLEARDANLLRFLDTCVFDRPGSPYAALLRHAGIERGDAATLVATEGTEGALGHLYDKGVYLSVGEFKGLEPIRRGSLELYTSHEDFDNPLLRAGYSGESGGSRGAPRRVMVDFEHLFHECAYQVLFMDAFALWERPCALWRPVPPARAGLQNALRSVKVGRPAERWFSQTPLSLRSALVRDTVLTWLTVAMSRSAGHPLPVPVHVPLAEAETVARWLAGKVEAGTAAHLDTVASSAVRVSVAARDAGLDLDGTLIRVGGEPFTRAKADLIEASGAKAVAHYTMAETGRIGAACADAPELDDVHLLTDRLALVSRAAGSDAGGRTKVVLTTLLPVCPKVMLNVETGDSAVVVGRDCGCAAGEIGFRTHLHTIRGDDKLTIEGMGFVGADVLLLVDELLPRRFGGAPTDYQLVDREQDGLQRLDVVVDPSVGPVDEREVVEVVLETLGSGLAYRRMVVDLWRQADAVSVVRRAPHATRTAKVQPLHVIRP